MLLVSSADFFQNRLFQKIISGILSESQTVWIQIWHVCSYVKLTLCMLDKFSCFSCRLLTFFKIDFFKEFFQEHYQYVNVGPNLGPICYQQTTKVTASKERLKYRIQPNYWTSSLQLIYTIWKGLSGRVLDSRPRGRGFEPHWCRVNPSPKWWWALKMGQWPIYHSNTCKFSNFNGPFEIFMGPLQNLMGPRILNILIRA